MTVFSTTGSNSKPARIFFMVSLAVFAFYCIVFIVGGDVYKFAVVGAIYELLYLPMLLCLPVLPVLSLIAFIRNKGKARIYAVLSILLIIGSIIIITAG